MTKVGSSCCKLPLQSTEEDRDEDEQATASKAEGCSSGCFFTTTWHFHTLKDEQTALKTVPGGKGQSLVKHREESPLATGW